MTSAPASDVQSEAPPPAQAPSRIVRIFRFVENAVVVLTLAAMMILPLLESLFRKLARPGISGSTQFVQHGSLILGLIGGAIAARQGRLLSMATAEFLPKGWPSAAAKIFSGTVAAVISAALCMASIQYVVEEYKSTEVMAYGISPWMLELAMPIGFGLIAMRIVLHSGKSWRGRTIAAVLAAGALAFLVLTNPRFARWAPETLPAGLDWLGKVAPTIEPETLFWPALGVLVASIFLGGPIFVMLGGAAVVFFWSDVRTLACTMKKAFHLARSGRPGPVLVDLPRDILAAPFGMLKSELSRRFRG